MSEKRVVTAEARRDDAGETSFRPLTLDEFVGQAQLRANLRVFIEAARARWRSDSAPPRGR